MPPGSEVKLKPRCQASEAPLFGDNLSLNLPILLTFIKTIDQGSVTASARALHLSQSAVSTHLATLTRWAEAPLYERRDGRIQPTTLGQVMYETGSEVVDRVALLAQRLRTERHRSEKTLNLLYCRAACEATLVDTLCGFKLAAPDIDVVIEIGDAIDVEARLEDHRADVVLFERSASIPNVSSFPYFCDRIRVAFSPAHSFTRHTGPIEIDQLLEEQVIVLKRPSALRRFIESRLGTSFYKLTINLELESDQTLIACIEAGIGISFVSDAALARPLELGKLDVRDVRGIDFRRIFVAAYRSDHTLRPVAKRFVDWLTTISQFAPTTEL